MNKEKKNDFLFSVVIPVYKVEDYVEETIQSVLQQTIGFEKHIQMILVNDGSPDNSGAVCEKYRDLYPENILYIEQENRGVSAARNNGLQYATGKYINFLDSDDKWEPDAFEQILHFAESCPKARVFCGRMRYFEATTAFHPLDYKFAESRYIDLNDPEETYALHLHITSSVLRTDFAKALQFVEGMTLGEDALYLNSQILRAGGYAAVREARLNYRRRLAGSSAIQNKEQSQRFYSETVEKFYFPLIDLSTKLYGKVVPYIQSLLVYDIGWRMRYGQPEILTDAQWQTYLDQLHQALQPVEDACILRNPVHRSIFRKEAVLRLKHGQEDVLTDLTYNPKNKKLFLKGEKVVHIQKNTNNCEIYNVEHRGDQLLVEGRIRKWIVDARCTTKFVLAFAGKEYPVELRIYPHDCEETMFGERYRHYEFSVHIPFDSAFTPGQTRWVRPRLYFGDSKCDVGTGYGGRRFLATKLCDCAYRMIDGYVVLATPQGLKIQKPKDEKATHRALERRYLKWLWHNKQKHIVWLRLLYWFLAPRHKKPLWIVSDREEVAGDNGEAFFRFLANEQPADIDYAFVINKGCPDDKRMGRYGRVLHFGTLRYKLAFLLADVILSSQANDFILNAFTICDNRYLRDLMHFDFVFLQHGITMNDLSNWLQKRNKKIDLFVTSAPAEQKSIVESNYGLEPSQVILTGLPRFDRLVSAKDRRQKQVLLMPTWRKTVQDMLQRDPEHAAELLAQTDFYRFYNSLIHHPALLQKMRQLGYSGKFLLHPMMQNYTGCFTGNDVFQIATPTDYHRLFTEGALLVTDYSSTFFDFCYLQKPVIYTQFDEDTFFAGQMYDRGYFDYRRDGFGPVCTDLDSTVTAICAALDADCALQAPYTDRVAHFYAYHDDQNARRVYDAVRSYQAKK